MKIKDYSKFQFIRGKLYGLAEWIENDAAKVGLIECADELEKLFLEFFQITPTIPVKKEEKEIKKENRVGAVTRPSAEKANKTEQELVEEEAFGEVFDE